MHSIIQWFQEALYVYVIETLNLQMQKRSKDCDGSCIPRILAPRGARLITPSLCKYPVQNNWRSWSISALLMHSDHSTASAQIWGFLWSLGAWGSRGVFGISYLTIVSTISPKPLKICKHSQHKNCKEDSVRLLEWGHTFRASPDCAKEDGKKQKTF